MKRLLITGATGFIGAHCLRFIMESDYDEIYAISRTGQGPYKNRVMWHAADLRNPAEATKIIEAIRPSHLFHAAWIATPGVYLSSPENFDWMRASIALTSAFAECGGQRFVGIGSSAEYASPDRPCEEDITPLQPFSIYGKCKIATWHAVQAFAQHYKFQAAWGRLFLPYGPGDSPEKLIPMALHALRMGKSLPLSHGKQQRDFIYAPDAARLLGRLLDSPAIGAFNIGSGNPRTVRSMLEAISDQLKVQSCLRFGELPLRDGEPAMLVASMKKFNEQLGNEPATPLSAALDELIHSNNFIPDEMKVSS